MSEQRNGEDPVWWFGMAFFVGGWGVLVLQIFWFLQVGEWTSVSVVEGGRMLAAGLLGNQDAFPWLFDPQSWLGVHSILNAIPSSLALVGFGFLTMAGVHTSAR